MQKFCGQHFACRTKLVCRIAHSTRLLVALSPCLLLVHFLPALNYLFSAEFVYSLTALASRKQCVGLLPLLLLPSPAAVSSSCIAQLRLRVVPSTRMQSIKLRDLSQLYVRPCSLALYSRTLSLSTQLLLLLVSIFHDSSGTVAALSLSLSESVCLGTANI